MQHRPEARRHLKHTTQGHDDRKKAHNKRPKQVSQHHQLQLLHKSIKKAKQFELRKLIRRLKAVTPAAAVVAARTQPKGSQDAAAVNKIQSQYDTTKNLDTEVVLKQAALKCNLSSFATAEQSPSALTDSLSDRVIQLACSRLLVATCVKQQMQAIMELHQQASQPAPLESIKDQGVLLGNASLAEDPAAQSSDHEPESDKCQDEFATDDEAAAQEDRQLAENAIARLLASRAAEAQDEQAASSQDDSSAQSNGTADGMQEAADSSADSQTAQAAGAPSMSVHNQATGSPQQAGLLYDGKSKHNGTNHTKLKVKENKIEKQKKKKNRLGQRARQQLGRAKQGQAMGFVQSNQRFRSKPSAAPMQKGIKATASSNPARLPRPTASISAVQPQSLHPSWAAKQKQKQAVRAAEPAGRKIVFSDNGQTVVEPVAARVLQPGASVSKAAASKRNKDRAEVLHPSWAAKRAAAAQKVDLASAPRVQKIVFDE